MSLCPRRVRLHYYFWCPALCPWTDQPLPGCHAVYLLQADAEAAQMYIDTCGSAKYQSKDFG